MERNEPAHEYITTQSQHIGTQSHQIIEDYLSRSLNLEDFDLLPIAHFHNLKPYLENIHDVTCIEQRMYSDKLKVAGTSDLIAKYNGGVIIDYKTRKPKLMNTCMNTICKPLVSQMFQEVTGQKINQVVILVSSEKNTRQEFVKTCDDYIEPLYERLEKYYLNSEVMP